MERRSGLLSVVLLACCMALLPAACSSDTDIEDEPYGGDTLLMGACMTRSASLTLSDQTQLTFFLTSGTTSQQRQFTYSQSSDSWSGNASVKTGDNYYIYGYMPTWELQSSFIARIGADYSGGAVVSLNGLKAVTDKDVCFVAGIAGGTSVTAASDITEWNYLYTGRDVGENHVNILLDHLYAAISMNFKIGATYAQLRTIKLKEVRLEPSSSSLVNVSIRQPAGAAPTVTYSAGSGSADVPTLFSDATGTALSTETALSMETWVIPSLTGLTLVCIYDVYDKAGNCVRQNQTARNSLDGKVTMTRGTRTTLNLTVAPSYLYVLSDDDLDNPTVELRVES